VYSVLTNPPDRHRASRSVALVETYVVGNGEKLSIHPISDGALCAGLTWRLYLYVTCILNRIIRIISSTSSECKHQHAVRGFRSDWARTVIKQPVSPVSRAESSPASHLYDQCSRRREQLR
jgi:hypothetical protein